MFKLTIETDNEAFDGNPVLEIVRILRELGGDMLDFVSVCALYEEWVLQDINGNTVGRATLEKEET